MSIFNRLITSLTGHEPVTPTVPERAVPNADAPSAQGGRRFMGREQAADASEATTTAAHALQAPGEYWVHIQPVTQRLLLVEELGDGTGQELSQDMMADLQRAGWCEEVAYYASYDEYWKMPTQEAILRMPAVYQIPCPLLNRIKLSSKLVKQGEARGYWLRVRMRTSEEVPPPAAQPLASL